jgi:transposase
MREGVYPQYCPVDSDEIINEAVWSVFKPILFKIRNTQGPIKRLDDRKFLSAVAFLVRTGKPWRELPSHYGNWHSVYMRFRRWEQSLVWAEMWVEMDDRAHDVFSKVFFDKTDIESNLHVGNYACIRARLAKAIEHPVA